MVERRTLKADAKTLMDRKLNRHLEKMETPTEEVDIGNFETIESLLGNQMEEVYMQLQLHYATAIRLLSHRDAVARKYQEENEQLRTQLEALRTRDPREKELKTTKIMNTQLKLYKEKYLDRDRVARAIELENFELREQLSALQQVGNAYVLGGGQDLASAMFPPAREMNPASPSGKPEMLFGSPHNGPPSTPLDRLERAQQKLESWASQHRSTLKRDLAGLVDVSELPAMELPGTLATRGSYGPTPKQDETHEEPEKPPPDEDDEDKEEVFYIRNAYRVDEEDETGPAYYIKCIRDTMKSWFFQGDRDMQDTYWSSGVCQYIARSSTFEHTTMIMIAANAVWLGVDVTYNNQILLINSEPVFIIMENIFCTYFFCEIVVRFGAFRKKCNVFRDFWFVFDFALVLAMVVDTWALLVVMAALDTNVYVINSSFLRMLRIIRISRLARVARIMRSVPEVMILFQGMGVASRSVICALSLLVTLVYVFSLAFTQLLRDTPAGDTYFPSLTHGYSTDKFLMVLRRFVSIRGYPSKLYSDNGSQLVAARAELKKVINDLDKKQLLEFGVMEGFEWKFSSADAPWQNGVSEALIKSVKKAITLAIGESVLTFSELQTICYEAANLVNERPIGRHPTSTDDTYLCPNDLLLGRATSRVPSGPFKEPSNIKQRFELVQQLTDSFWRKWTRDYFPSLLVQQKWHTAQRNLEIDDIVLIQDSNAKRGQWKLGKISKVYKGEDGKVRRALVEYKNPKPGEKVTEYKGKGFTTIERPVNKLITILPASEHK